MTRTSKRAKASKRNGLKGAPPTEKLSEQQSRELLDWGYTIVSYPKAGNNNVPEWKQAALSNKILDEGSFIFNNSDHGHPGDYTRLQLFREWPKLPGLAAKRISKRIEATFPHLSPGDAQLLYSIAGGHDQRPHTDITAGFDELKSPEVEALHRHIQSGRIPLSVIITFSKPSTLHVWPGSMNTIWAESTKDKNEWSKVVRIPPFSALIFRQDLVHAGAKYKTNNLRLHFYMDLNADDYKPQKGHTFYVDKKYWRLSSSTKK